MRSLSTLLFTLMVHCSGKPFPCLSEAKVQRKMPLNGEGLARLLLFFFAKKMVKFGGVIEPEYDFGRGFDRDGTGLGLVMLSDYKLSQTKTATFGKVAVFVLLLKKEKR